LFFVYVGIYPTLSGIICLRLKLQTQIWADYFLLIIKNWETTSVFDEVIETNGTKLQGQRDLALFFLCLYAYTRADYI
jgi:hypothetical protein